jgi:hypothetical protein
MMMNMMNIINNLLIDVFHEYSLINNIIDGY